MLWLVFAGNFHRDELILGGASVVLTTAFFVFVKRCEELKLELGWSDGLQALWIPWYVGVGLIEILVVLGKDVIQIQKAKSLFLMTGFRAHDDPRGNARRVLAVLYTTVTPNFIVISVDPSRQQMLYHQLEESSLPKMTRNLGAIE